MLFRSFRLNIETTEEELEKLLKIIQEFEPIGIGARNLQECLLLQISARQKTKQQELAQTILSDYFDEFTKKHYNKILAKLGITQQDLKEAIDEIVKLNPRPGGKLMIHTLSKLSKWFLISCLRRKRVN